MTGDQIRCKLIPHSSKLNHHVSERDWEHFKIKMLQEIAAQLADLNAHLRSTSREPDHQDT
jgi:hypothetical protein